MGTVLIVDDHQDTCRMLQVHLHAVGYETECAADAAAAAALMADRVPGLVLIDVLNDRGPDGLGLLGRIRAGSRTGHLPVVMYTAHQGDEYRRAAAALGVQGYLLKAAASFLQDVEAHARRLLPA